MNVQWSQENERKINECGGSIILLKIGKKKHITSYYKGKGMSIMIWAAIWGDGHTEIYQMSRDEAST